jgi:hypothetical protein
MRGECTIQNSTKKIKKSPQKILNKKQSQNGEAKNLSLAKKDSLYTKVNPLPRLNLYPIRSILSD